MHGVPRRVLIRTFQEKKTGVHDRPQVALRWPAADWLHVGQHEALMVDITENRRPLKSRSQRPGGGGKGQVRSACSVSNGIEGADGVAAEGACNHL